MPLSSIEEALADLKAGKFVIVVDDESRENEGDLVVLADLVTPEHVTFMARAAGGLICLPVAAERLDQLAIEPMVRDNTSRHSTAFSVSIEARDLVTTGISAQDRAATIRHVVNPAARPEDFAKPGHTFPLRAAPGGVLVRSGHTEAAVDLARLAGHFPAGVICEILNDSGEMARLPELESLGASWGVKIVSVADLIAHRRRTERLINLTGVVDVPIEGQLWKGHLYQELIGEAVHVAMVLGEMSGDRDTLVRVHSCCLTGDVLGSQRCDCGPQLQHALSAIAAAGSGVLLYLSNQEGRGIGLLQKLRAYRLQDEGMDTVDANQALDQPADSRDYGVGYQILRDLGVRRIRLLTNNPRKLAGLEAHGLEMVEQVAIQVPANVFNQRYLATKKARMGHLL